MSMPAAPGADAAARSPTARRGRTRARSPPRARQRRRRARAAPVPRHYETMLDEADARALARRRSGAPSSSASTPRPPASIRCRRGSSACRSRSSRATRATSRSRTAIAGAPDQLPLDAVLARLEPWFDDPAREEARPERQVRPARARQSRHAARRRRARHAAPVLRARVAPAARHGQPRVAPSRREDDRPTPRSPARARRRSASTRWRSSDATEYAAEDADITLQLHRRLYPRIAGDAKLDYVYAAIEMPVREVLFRMERNGVLLDCELLGSAEPRAGRARAGARAAGLSSSRASRSISDRRSSSARSCSSKMKLPVGQEDGDRAAVDRRGRAAASSPPTIRCRSCCSSTARCRSSSRPTPTSCRRWSTRATGRVHTTFRQATAVTGRLAVDRPEPAEHSGAHAGRPAHSRGVHRAAGTRARLGRLFADRAADHGAPVRRPGAAEGVSRGRRHPSRDGGRDLRRAAGRGHRATSAATSRRSISD